MRKVILQEFVTIDGLVAGPNAGVDFIPESTAGDQSLERRQQELLETIDTIVLGRVTIARPGANGRTPRWSRATRRRRYR